MNKSLQIELPTLNEYRQNFIQQGVSTPLLTVPFSRTGLLAELPSPPAGKTGWPWTIETQPLITLPNSLPCPKISIVTPSYNQGQFLEETIRSVLLQNYPNLEYIVIDGGSNDETREILKRYSPWLSFWQSQKDRGQGHAINLGFSLANGSYYGWVNSDDFYMPNCFQLVASHFLKYCPEFIYGDAIDLEEESFLLKYRQAFFVLDRYLRFGGIISSHACFWNSNIHQPIWEELNCAVDAELWLRLVLGKSKSHLNFPLGVARNHPQTKTNHERYRLLWEDDYKNKIWKVYPAISPHIWRLLCYEFRLVQDIHSRMKKILIKEEVLDLLKRNNLRFT